MEANLAAIEVGRARARVLTAERELSASRQELQRLTGIDRAVVVVAREEGDLPAGPNAGTLDPDSILQMALSRRPDLEARARAAEQARALTALARREAIPNLEIGALARRETPGTESRFGIGVRLSVRSGTGTRG